MNLMRHVNLWLANDYCSIIVVNYGLIWLIRFVSRISTHLCKKIINKFYLIVLNSKIFFLMWWGLKKNSWKQTKRDIRTHWISWRQPGRTKILSYVMPTVSTVCCKTFVAANHPKSVYYSWATTSPYPNTTNRPIYRFMCRCIWRKKSQVCSSVRFMQYCQTMACATKSL